MKMNEKQVMPNIRLTHNQKEILSMILASPGGNVPEADLSDGPNRVSARETLLKLNLITKDATEHFNVTQAGKDVSQDANIIDATGNITQQTKDMLTNISKAVEPVSEGTLLRKLLNL